MQIVENRTIAQFLVADSSYFAIRDGNNVLENVKDISQGS